MSVLDSGMNSVNPFPGCGKIHGNVRIPILIYALCFFLSTPARCEPFPTDAQANRSPADAIVGVWGTEQTMGPMVRGELTVDGRAPEWRARIAGFETRVERKHEGIRFELPGAGEFRGHMDPGGKRISGHWIETAGIAFYSYQYASPIELSEVSPNVWRGVVVPLEERVSFYVSVERSPNGSLTAFVRNPEANRFRGHGFDVELKDGSVIFSYQGKTQLLGTYDQQGDVLSLPLVGSYPLLQLTRRNRGNAPGFYPRTPQESYVYQQPVAENDGWAVGSLSEAGLDAGPIEKLIERILTTAPSLTNPVNIQGLLIARHGKLVLEEYFYGFDKERPHDMRSASKTFGPVLIGLAREHGAKIELDSPVYSFFPEYKPFANWDERKNKMTVQNLMNMTSGLACDDHDPSSAGGEDPMQDQTAQPDWYKFALDLPMARNPGGKDAVYCSSDINLLGGIVSNATGKWLPEFFDQYLAQPLQISSYHMNLMPTGEAYMGGGLYLRPRDQLKLGQLYLSRGVWNGRRVISEAWVRDSFTPHSSFPSVIDVDLDHGYTNAWHTRPLKVGDRVYRDYYAGGNGGQFVLVIPDLDMVVGITGGDYSERDKFFRWEIQMVPEYIIPAAH